MRGLLLDTNVLPELRRPAPNPDLRRFIAAQPESRLSISEISLAEIRYGTEQRKDPERRAALRGWLTHSLRPAVAGRALRFSEDIIVRWRLMLEAGRARGCTFGQLDLFIAATVAEEDLVVVSRDIEPFVAAGVPILDPWTSRYINARGVEAQVGNPATPFDPGRE